MTEHAVSGSKLLFDLLAASAEPAAPSAFETAAWAVAAEHPRGEDSPTHRTKAPDEQQVEAHDGSRLAAEGDGVLAPAREDVARRSSAPATLQLVDDAEPPLNEASWQPPLTSSPAPGPRVSAFAAATGAALGPLRHRTETHPPEPMSGTEAPERNAPSAQPEHQPTEVSPTPATSTMAEPGTMAQPDSSQPILIPKAEPAASPYPTSTPRRRLEAPQPDEVSWHGVPGLPPWIGPPLIPTRPEDAPDLLATVADNPTAAAPTPSETEPAAPASRQGAPSAPEAPVGDANGDATDRMSVSAMGSQSVPSMPVAGPDPLPSATLTRTLPLVADDDDFGPLVLPEPSRRRRARSHDEKYREAMNRSPRMAWLGAGAALLLIVAALVGWRVASQPAGAATPPDASRVEMVEWHGMSLPVSTSAGPAERSETSARGFARTPLGAAIAAAHLSVRVDPSNGPTVFEPVLADQVVGAKDRLADAVRAQADSETNAGAPGSLLGWRLGGDSAAATVTVHLGVEQANGTRADYAIPLAWADGDWRINAPSSGPFFPITDLTGTYAPFVEETTS